MDSSLEIVRRDYVDYETAVAAPLSSYLVSYKAHPFLVLWLTGSSTWCRRRCFAILYRYGTLKVPAAGNKSTDSLCQLGKTRTRCLQQVSSDEEVTNKSLVLSILSEERARHPSFSTACLIIHHHRRRGHGTGRIMALNPFCTLRSNSRCLQGAAWRVSTTIVAFLGYAVRAEIVGTSSRASSSSQEETERGAFKKVNSIKRIL
jgi:hypothetical protein